MSYPIITGYKAWQYKQVKSLLGGINTNAASDEIEDNQAITLRNVVIRQDQVQVDTGYVITGQVLFGQPQATYTIEHRNLTDEQIAITTKTVYNWNVAFAKWELLKGTAGTTTTASYTAGATVIAVTSAVGFSNNDIVAIYLDNGDQLQTTITISGLNFTLANAVPVGRTVALGAIVNRAPMLSGSLDKQVSIVTVPSNDWMVFTNQVDIVQHYDGTAVTVVPNLPSAGNVVCGAVALYNAALFLIRTVEGGTNYNQRVRRSDQGDPTNWTTGTSGFDDLLDLSDMLLTAELLGPYLVVYRERGIVRGSFIGNSGVNYQWETTVNTEGALSAGAVVNMGDMHYFVGHANVYEYRGDFSITAVGDEIYYSLLGYQGDLDPSYIQRLFITYIEEVDEVWIAYPTILSPTHCPDKVLRYNTRAKFWYDRKLYDTIIGYGFYVSALTVTWATATGTWQNNPNQWNTRQNLSNVPITQLCLASTNNIVNYDYAQTLDNGQPIKYTIETKDFTIPDGEFRFDYLEAQFKGNSVLVEYSPDAGNTYVPLGTVTQLSMDKAKFHKQFVSNKVRFRFSGIDSVFSLEWFGFLYKAENLSNYNRPIV